MSLGALGKKESLSEKAYQMLRQAVFDGELKPGDILTEEGTASLLAISRTPVRTALQQLTREGILKTEKKNLVVAGVDRTELAKIDQVRRRIEPLSASLCAKRGISAEEQQELLDCLALQEKAAGEKQAKDFFLQCEKFHVRIAALSGNSFLAEMIEMASTKAARFMASQETPEVFIDDSPSEHRKILDAIVSGDAALAENLMQEHIRED